MTRTVETIPTPDEVEAIIRACQSPRDRALFGMLWDGGFRIVELGTLTWGQVKFDQFGCAINVNAKTEYARYVRLLGSSAYLAQWRDCYPCQITNDALVFLTRQHRPLTYDVVAVQLPEAGEESRSLEAAHPACLPPWPGDGPDPPRGPRNRGEEVSLGQSCLQNDRDVQPPDRCRYR